MLAREQPALTVSGKPVRLVRRLPKGADIPCLFIPARNSVERDVGPIEVCLYNAGSNVNTPLLATTETLFRKSWALACYGGFLTGRPQDDGIFARQQQLETGRHRVTSKGEHGHGKGKGLRRQDRRSPMKKLSRRLRTVGAYRR